MSSTTLNLPDDNACGCIDAEFTGNIECICPATGLVQIVGRKYALRLMNVIEDNQSIRFNELKDLLGDISSSTLTIRLAELEKAGLIGRRSFSETPPRVEYTLTSEGRSLRKSLFSLSRFASRK